MLFTCLSLLDIDIFHITLFLNIYNSYPCHKVGDYTSYPYKTAGNSSIIFYCKPRTRGLFSPLTTGTLRK
jgi:hypothetical protein